VTGVQTCALPICINFFLMFLSLLNLKGANKKFIHTEHSSTINESK